MNLLKKWISWLLRRLGFKLIRLPALDVESLQRDFFENVLTGANGVLHIGAHLGQEMNLYLKSEVNVIWVEAIPQIADSLRDLLPSDHSQVVRCALLGDRDLEAVQLRLSSNNFESSSIFDFGEDLGFQNLEMVDSVILPMLRMDSVFSFQELRDFEVWVVDVQGAELQVLQGAGDLISLCKVIQIEVSTREVYSGGTSWSELKDFLNAKGFTEYFSPGAGQHLDLIFCRTN